jgi:hypothetical protein
MLIMLSYEAPLGTRKPKRPCPKYNAPFAMQSKLMLQYSECRHRAKMLVK